MIKEGQIILSNYVAELNIQLGSNIKCEINKINSRSNINGNKYIVGDIKVLEGAQKDTIFKDVYIPIFRGVKPKKSRKKKCIYTTINEIDIDLSLIGKMQNKVLNELIDFILPIKKDDFFNIAIIDLDEQKKEKNLLLEIIDDLSKKTVELETKEGFKVYYSLLDFSLQENNKCIITMDWIRDTRDNTYINYFNLIDGPVEVVLDKKLEKQKDEFWKKEFIEARKAEYIV
ncbi:hypothetical protein RSJ2_3819 (plasmid) [Clostridium botulinum]|uniref:hypothetical protein n=1 Tax=Clostridium botulinum TaxID=1491 RepID=UPI00094745EF|nr:hypothetical protein [Clostridium botulinum]APR02627.1 hypothetical protein RSJ2_3819 [Clostridium botulinum]AUN19787.1 hypothetical protein B2M06_19735 [Clostridium botulinum]OSA84512.1 hypothetical protein B2H91_16155 [Clostridium botulinum]